MKNKQRIAILGGGPSGLFMFKRLVDCGQTNITVDIFEKKSKLGLGMPYSTDGANDEHVTNVSGNEIPELVTPMEEWIDTIPKTTQHRFDINAQKYNDYKVVPRLLFGQYLSAQFDLLCEQGRKLGILNKIHLNSHITDIIDNVDKDTVVVEVNGKGLLEYDRVIICTGHRWPLKYEGKIPHYFDSPYPPSKLQIKINHPVAIKGASLTAIDAIRTLARQNGAFVKTPDGKKAYQLNHESNGMKIIMHSRNGLLPAVRFHLEDPHLSKTDTLTTDEMQAYRAAHNGFLSLDYIFEENFKQLFPEKRPAFYALIKDMKLEDFVHLMMNTRESIDPFQLFKNEYDEAERSIKNEQSVYWKEVLAILSFTMNYPAKYLPAEDMQRLQKVLMPLISIVIAFVPQGSCEELMALHNAGVLDIISVGDDSNVVPDKRGGATYHYTDEAEQAQAVHFKTFIDCVGQPHLNYEDLPYKSLIEKKTVNPARLLFKDEAEGARQLKAGHKDVAKDSGGNYYLKVPGITIDDNFSVVDQQGVINHRIYMMAVPYIGGFNPDYSGLDFCEAASERIIESMLKTK